MSFGPVAASASGESPAGTPGARRARQSRRNPLAGWTDAAGLGCALGYAAPAFVARQPGASGVPVMFRGILDQINFPELPTIYGPVLQFVFLLGYAVGPGSVAPLQAIFVLADLLAIGLLLRLAPARSVLLYAWCPLVVKEIAFTAHPDGFAVCLLLAAVALSRRERLFAAAGLLALSAGAKALALPLVPFVLLRARFAHWLTFYGVLALLYLPFEWRGGTDLSTLFVFAREWEFNASGFRVLGHLLPDPAARLAVGLAFFRGRCPVVSAVPAVRPAGPALRAVTPAVAGGEPLVSALVAALCGDASQRLGLDGFVLGAAFLRHRDQPAESGNASFRASVVGRAGGVRRNPGGGGMVADPEPDSAGAPDGADSAKSGGAVESPRRAARSSGQVAGSWR